MPAHDYKQSSTFYSDITATTVDFLTKHRFALIVAQAAAESVCNMIRLSFGGEILYVKRETIANASDNNEFSHLFIGSVTNTLLEHDTNEQLSSATAVNLYDVIKGCIGGEQIYIPKEKKRLAKLRAVKIVNEFNGRNAKELARKYDYSVSHIQRIVKQAYLNKKTTEAVA